MGMQVICVDANNVLILSQGFYLLPYICQGLEKGLIHILRGSPGYMRRRRKVSNELTSSISLTAAYLGPGAVPSNRDAVRFGELSSEKVARPNPMTPVDAARVKAERPVHLADACPELAALGVLLVAVEGLLRGALAENGRRHPPMRRRVALFANITWRRQMLHKRTQLLHAYKQLPIRQWPAAKSGDINKMSPPSINLFFFSFQT